MKQNTVCKLKAGWVFNLIATVLKRLYLIHCYFIKRCIINEIGKATRLNENCVRPNKQFLISSHTDLYGLEKDFSFGLCIHRSCQICGITNNKVI